MKEMESGTKKTIIIGSLLLALSIILIVFITAKSKPTYIIVNDRGYQYKDNAWENIDLTSPIFGKYRFNVYEGTEKKGTYEMNYVNDQWYFFDNKNDSHKINPDSLFAYYGKVRQYDYSIEELGEEDLNTINPILKEKGYNFNGLEDLTVYEKISYDFDNDSKLETIYNINNFDSNIDNLFSVLLYVDSSYNFPSLVNISLFLSSVISSCVENVEVNLIK